MNWKDYLATIYFNPNHPASFSGPDKIYEVVKSESKYKIGRYRIRKWLQDQEAYSLTRGARRHFQRSRVIVNGIDSMWDMDLMDMVSLSKENDNFKYVLVVIDIFSRYTWCQPLKVKTGTEVIRALTKILNGDRKPNTIRTDKGSEFKNTQVSKFLKGLNINHIVTQNETKANYAERVIKTIKHKLFRYMLKTRKKEYMNKLQDFVYSYNHTVHRSLGKNPASLGKDNESESRLQQYLLRQKGQKKNVMKEVKKKIKRKIGYKYKLGQTVRISHVRGMFDREYSQKWTGELFKVKSRYKREGIPVYTL